MFVRPGEWRKEKTIWLAWPYDESLWQEDLVGAQLETVELVAALAQENTVLLVPTKEELDSATAKIKDRGNLSFKVMPYGDIWLRDTMPIFVKDERGKTAAVIPTFNGWGNKYLFVDDEALAARVADVLLVHKISSDLVFEGGAIDCDGAGTLLTTESCLLNPNRNPLLAREDVEEEFARLFGVSKVIWLKDGLKNDHTDGHIDTIARFIGPQHVAIMVPEGRDDPNYDVLMAIKSALELERDAYGNPLQLVELPSPGAVLNRDGELMPASYVNCIIGDATVVVPQYGSPHDHEAVRIMQAHCTERVVGVSAKSILSGGGAFHCMSQEFYR